MDRRSLLKGIAGVVGATVGAFALRNGVDAREGAGTGIQGQSVGATLSAVPFSGAHWPADATWGYDPAAPSFLYEGVEEGQTMGEMTLVTGPDPDTMVHVITGPDAALRVLPSWDAMPADRIFHISAIPRAEFPEFDPRHGTVDIADAGNMISANILAAPNGEVALIRAAYAYTVAHRTPDRPFDGNHLAMRFMPRTMIDVAAYLDGVKVPGVTESYSSPSGWLVQMIGTTDERGRYQPTLFGDSLRSRIVTGNVELRIGDAIVWPGDHTAPLLP